MSVEKIRVRCECSSEFQDRTYGKGIRAANPVDKSRKNNKGRCSQATCTVCGRVHTFAGQEVVAGANGGRG